MKPETAIQKVVVEQTIMAASGGVDDGDKVGNSYNANDVEYSNEGGSLWDDED